MKPLVCRFKAIFAKNCTNSVSWQASLCLRQQFSIESTHTQPAELNIAYGAESFHIRASEYTSESSDIHTTSSNISLFQCIEHRSPYASTTAVNPPVPVNCSTIACILVKRFDINSCRRRRRLDVSKAKIAGLHCVFRPGSSPLRSRPSPSRSCNQIPYALYTHSPTCCR